MAWLAFYEPFGIGPEMVYKYYLMPLIGVMDIMVALATLFVPTRCVWAYAVFWCIFTAFLRPLTGQGFAEFFERGGNYGPPMALAVYCGLHFRSIKDWFSLLDPPKLNLKNVDQLILVLRLAIAFLMIGHGGFFILNENNQRDYLIQHWAAVGIDLTIPAMLAIGWFQVALGVVVFFKPARHLLILIAVWKAFSEALYPISGVPNGYVWEWVERSGDYWAPFALILLMHWREIHSAKKH
ncbi:MAG: hypothetical protein CMH70_05495 [Nitrosomonadaceae bacterium]|nr:hypothetical protein [Nitrosomonadaceae bacterium]